MGAAKKTAHPGCSKGGAYGYLGKPNDAYTEDDLHDIGKQLVEYMNEPRSIWYKGFCNRIGITEDHFQYLKEKYPVFARYADQAKQIQKEKLVVHSFWKEGDGNFAKFILGKCHEEFKEEKIDDKQANQTHTFILNYDGNTQQILPKTVSVTDSAGAG